MNARDRLLAPWHSPVPLTGVLAFDVPRYLDALSCAFTAAHCADVAEEARALAGSYGADPARAEAAGWLHDVSAVIPRARRIEIAQGLGVPVLPEEQAAPVILHQKLSAVLAEAIFGIDDARVLDAVRYHTTLHPDADLLAKVVFLADKIRWDQVGQPPYLDDLARALEAGSLDAAVCVYLGFLWERRAALMVVHPWMAAAYCGLCEPAGGRP
ncbi:MAG: bis(5'-nucleosyl)-tetraphosphatase (symmetrical) YqeK [Anaerolineae bacterium]|nr:bis(5'-nucleosyl)-tetraphosphatase (symmetrical) YqeK [Anaerolineae bacterium]